MKTKTQNLWSLLCKKAIVDKETNLISIIEIVEKLIVDIDMEKAPDHVKEALKEGKKPLQIGGEMAVASYWALSEELAGKEIFVSTVIKDGKGKELGNAKFSFIAQEGDRNHRTFLKLPSFPVTQDGTYTIVSTLKDKANKILAKSVLPITVEVKNTFLG
jgi:hypothetical protein